MILFLFIIIWWTKSSKEHCLFERKYHNIIHVFTFDQFNAFLLNKCINFLKKIIVMNLVTTHYNCTSPMDYISHHALHTHIPVHHYTNHTAVTIHSLVLIASPHLHLILTLTFKQHSHLHSLRSLVLPWLHFRAVSLVCTTWTVDSLSWLFAACLTDPACLLVILSVCCLPWSIALPLFMYLSYLRCPRYHYLIFACLTSSLYQ